MWVVSAVSGVGGVSDVGVNDVSDVSVCVCVVGRPHQIDIICGQLTTPGVTLAAWTEVHQRPVSN